MSDDIELTEEFADEPVSDKSRFGSANFKRAVVGYITGNQSPEDILATLGALGKSQTMSLHSEDPGNHGDLGEIEGGGYARQPIAWGEAVGGEDGTASVATSAPVVFHVSAGTPIRYYGVWLGDSFLYAKELTTPVELDEDGSVAITATHAYGLKA